MPAIASVTNPRHAYVKTPSGDWQELEACTDEVAFGEDDALYRKGCDGYLYVWQPENEFDEWSQLGDRQIDAVSGSKDSVWIVDAQAQTLWKFDDATHEFAQKGSETAHWLTAGQ